MNIERLRNQLAVDEGCKATAYKDTKEIWTIGIGHNLNEPIPQEAINIIFEHDIRHAIDDCIRMFPNWYSLPELKQEVICNMMFNMGYGTLSKFKRFRAAIEKMDWQEAAKEMVDSAWYTDVKDRAKRLVEIMKR